MFLFVSPSVANFLGLRRFYFPFRSNYRLREGMKWAKMKGLRLGTSTTGEDHQGGGLTNVFNLKREGKGTQEGLAKWHSADKYCVLSKAEKSLLHIYFKNQQPWGGLQHLASGSIITLRHSEPVSDRKRPIYKTRKGLTWISVSPLPCPPRVGRSGNPQQLRSHKIVFKRKYKVPNWSSLGEHVTEPRPSASLTVESKLLSTRPEGGEWSQATGCS